MRYRKTDNVNKNKPKFLERYPYVPLIISIIALTIAIAKPILAEMILSMR